MLGPLRASAPGHKPAGQPGKNAAARGPPGHERDAGEAVQRDCAFRGRLDGRSARHFSRKQGWARAVGAALAQL
jgi:hypothetical protein